MKFDLPAGATERERKLAGRIVSRCFAVEPPADPLARKVVGPCWAWAGCLNKPNGYGRISVSGAMRLAHRVAKALTGAEIEDMDVDHLCRNHACCNPDHLEVVLHRENCRRGKMQKHLVNKRCAHCGSTRGVVRNTPHGSVGWNCRDCAAARARRNKNAKVRS